MLFDTHVHFDGFRESAELSAVLERAEAAGVMRMMAVGGNTEGNRLAVSLAQKHPGRIGAAVGYDRDQAGREGAPTEIEDVLKEDGVLAVGEIGLDYHYSPGTAAAQQRLFEQMLALARPRRLPVIVHSREADRDTLSLLNQHAGQFGGDRARLGILHCFTGGLDFAKAVLDLGMLISFSGIITFRNAGELREVARAVPEDRLLMETDAPLLAPAPKRGQANEPANLVYVAEMLAKIRNDTVEHIAHITARNAEQLFRLQRDPP